MPDQLPELTADEIVALYGALRSVLNSLSVQDIRNTAAAAGIDVSRITAKAEARSGVGSRAEVMPTIDRLFSELSSRANTTALRILAERLTRHQAELRDQVQDILGRYSFQFIEGAFVPIGVLDLRETSFLPATSASELARATSRLVDGDLTGAITSACGAVDLATQEIYAKYTLGDPGQASFQTKVNTALSRVDAFGELERHLAELGIASGDAASIAEHTR